KEMRQYEMCELKLHGPVLTQNYAAIDLTATISNANGSDSRKVKGFYAGDGEYRVRFLPKEAGTYTYTITGCITGEGSVCVEKATGHGMVKADGQHFRFEDGAVYHPFGTTVYALAHQEDSLVAETMETLSHSHFNKIRLCLFPKHYEYNHNEPKYYAFEKDEEGNWDVSRPCTAFWDDFEAKMCRLDEMGIQVDLILFHPYDRWGFAELSQKDNLTYLDYLLRRFAAYPFFWWSLANEYDLCYPHKTKENFEEIEEYVAANDPYHHLLSCHNCFAPWDFDRANVTHVSYQTKALYHVADWYTRHQKPVMVDECCYEGNLPYLWGCITGEEMTSRFWSAVVSGGYCTHGETFLDEENEIVWWAKGGRLIGESPKRIAFLKEFVYSLPGNIEPVQEGISGLFLHTEEEIREIISKIPENLRAFAVSASAMTAAQREAMVAGEHVFSGRVGTQVYLTYIDNFGTAEYVITLPVEGTYRVEVIDTWEMTRSEVLNGVNGKVTVPLPGKTHMAIAAFAE
ncbi:MAG: DUF4038 domain-containing protein, partial [Lachnospiraceae bacterium]|nr:DUF4038 domain-containing protein [Lachnospiraceae bacterium]